MNNERKQQLVKLASLRRAYKNGDYGDQSRNEAFYPEGSNDAKEAAFGPARIAAMEAVDLKEEIAQAKQDRDMDLINNLLQRTDLSDAEKKTIETALTEVEEMSGVDKAAFGPEHLRGQKRAWYPGSGSHGQTGGRPRDPDNKAKVEEMKKVLDRAGLWKGINWQFSKYTAFDNFQVGWDADEVGDELVMVSFMWEWNERRYYAWIDPMEGSMQATDGKDLSGVVRWLKKHLKPYMNMR